MVVRTIEILLEYIGTILCIHKIGKQKVHASQAMIYIFIVDICVMFLIDKGIMSPSGKAIVLGGLLVYIRMKVADSWKKSIGIYVIVMLTMMVLQYLVFLIFSILQIPIQNMTSRGLIINFVVLNMLLFWKEKYYKIAFRKMKELSREGIILVITIICLRLLYLCNKQGVIKIETLLQFYVEILGLCLALTLWLGTEIEKRHKEKELKMYELYNHAFEETIATIRMRQHEFQNHINAIKCMKYSIENQDELLIEQERYCDDVLRESSIANLLKLRMDPVLVGFLYAKITTAQDAGIQVEYEVNPIDIRGRIETYEMIELIGGLFDNAVEALKEMKTRKIMLKLVNIEKGFIVEVANISRIYSNNEIENFCSYGYSTKAKNRGIGLARIKEIIRKTRATLLIQNQSYKNENYLCFKVCFENDSQ